MQIKQAETTSLAPCPASALLASTSKRDSQAPQAVPEVASLLIAFAFALYIKTKSLHWHLAASSARFDHLLLDEQAERIFASIDRLARRVRLLCGTVTEKKSQYSLGPCIEGDRCDGVEAADMMKQLIEDHRHLAKWTREALVVCDTSRDAETERLVLEILDETERRIGLLFEIL